MSYLLDMAEEELLQEAKELVERLDTQDNVGTALPIMHVVQTKVLRENDTDGDPYWINCENVYSFDEAVEYLEEIIDDEEELKEVKEFDTYDLQRELEDLLNKYTEETWTRLDMSWHYEDTLNIFFTREAAQNFIDCNSYHFKEPRISVRHFWRNYEVKLILDIVRKFAEEE